LDFCDCEGGIFGSFDQDPFNFLFGVKRVFLVALLHALVEALLGCEKTSETVYFISILTNK
jgi:hypothetical protein